MGVDEDLLEDVLGVLAALQHRAAEGQEAGLVPVDEDLEGTVVAGPDQRDEAFVTLELEDRGAPSEKTAPGCV
jgi:hypothetical protein